MVFSGHLISLQRPGIAIAFGPLPILKEYVANLLFAVVLSPDGQPAASTQEGSSQSHA
jgi:hypothetical protein